MRELTIPEWWKYLSNTRNKDDSRLRHFMRGVAYGYFTGDIVTEYIKEGFKGVTPITAQVSSLMKDIGEADMREIVQNAAKRIASQTASDTRMLGLADMLLGKHGLADAIRKEIDKRDERFKRDFLRNIPFEYAASVLGQDIFMDKFRQHAANLLDKDDEGPDDYYDDAEPAVTPASEFAALLPTITSTIKNVGLTDENIKEILGELKKVMGEFREHRDVYMVAEFLNGIVDHVPEAVDDLIEASEMKEIMETNGVPYVRGDAELQESYKPMSFKQYLNEEAEEGARVVRWFFADGLVPIGKGAVAPWQKVELPNAKVEGSALGAMVIVHTSDPAVKGGREVSGLAFVHTGNYITFCKAVGIKA